MPDSLHQRPEGEGLDLTKIDYFNTFYLIYKMKFPITRQSLQEYDYVKDREELQEEENQKSLMQILEVICMHFKQNMQSNSKEKKYVWKGISSVDHKYLPQFIEKLKETFIGCDIIIDPLKTYLIIDWS
jgi:hypothetical protein